MMKKLSRKGSVNSLILILIIAALSIPMGFYGMYLYIAPSLPDMKSLRIANLQKPIQIYTKDGELIAEFGDKLSLPVEYKEIPKPMVNAFLAAEDSSFFEHSGVSFKGLGRAISEMVSGGSQTGGSTITMQVAKNYFLSPERTMRRKITEIFLARRIEQTLPKEDIITLYVNKIFLGKNAYGIAAAAQVYYQKELNELTLAQMAMIAGLPKAPSRFNPAANPEKALERRNWILGRMHQLGYINQASYQKARQEPLNLNMQTRSVKAKFPYIAELVRTELVDNFGSEIINSGYRVYTTVDSKRQESAETSVRNGLESYARRHGWRGPEAHDKPLSNFFTVANKWPAKVTKVNVSSFEAELKSGEKVTVYWSGMAGIRRYRSADRTIGGPSRASQLVKEGDIVRLSPNKAKSAWSLTQIPKVQGQLTAINPNSGAIEALVGGYDFYHSKFNRATQGWRQPGSTIKPFVYALALEKGMTPHSTVSDNPIRIHGWRPKNSDGRYLGMIPLRRALYLSRNTVSVRLMQRVGLEPTRQMLISFGLSDEHIPHNYTVALGTPDVLPIQMATGYATFANGGFRVQPYIIEKITDVKGKTVFEVDPAYACVICVAEQKRNEAKQAAEDKETGKDDEDKDSANDKDTKKDKDTQKAKDTKQPAISKKELEQYRQAERILSSRSAYEMAGILRDVIQVGTGRAALRLGRRDLGGKTGTTNQSKDAWFAGFNGDIVTIVWVGFDAPSTLGRREYGGVAALPIWINFMRDALKGKPYSWVKIDPKATKPKQGGTDKIIEEQEPENPQRRAPPLARAIYVPQVQANTTRTQEQKRSSASTRTRSSTTTAAQRRQNNRRSDDNDFADLPGTAIVVPKSNRSSSSNNSSSTSSKPKKADNPPKESSNNSSNNNDSAPAGSSSGSSEQISPNLIF